MVELAEFIIIKRIMSFFRYRLMRFPVVTGVNFHNIVRED